MSKQMNLATAIHDLVTPGMHLHFASTPSRSNAAIREVVRRFQGTLPGFVLSTSGFHSMAHLLGLYRLGRRYIACFFGDNYPVPRPNRLYGQLIEEGAALEHWSLWSYVTALRAGALGHAYGITNSLRGTTLGEELAAAGRVIEVPDPAGPELAPLMLVKAMRPDITFVHAPLADTRGNVAAAAPYAEGFWAAAGATRGTIVTVERVVEPNVLARYPDLVKIPHHRVLAVCHEPFGAHPQPVYSGPLLEAPGYRDDLKHYELWRSMAEDPALLRGFSDVVLSSTAGAAGYRAFVGADRLEELSQDRSPTAPAGRPEPRIVRSSRSPKAERLVLAAARAIADRVRARGYRSVLAGIGQAFLAARLAKLELADEGIAVDVVVETGLLDIACGPSASEFLLSYENIAQARRLSSVEDALGTVTCGAANTCLGVIGAAQIDERGDVNSSRLSRGELLVGSGGANDIASSAAEVIVLARCERDRLVRSVDYITSPGRKVRRVITDCCTFERDDDTPAWRLTLPWLEVPDASMKALLSTIRERCPWDYTVSREPTPAASISERENRLLDALVGDRPA